MSINRALLGPLTADGLMDVWYDSYDRQPRIYRDLYKVQSSTRAYEEWTGVTGALGLAQEVVEDGSVTYVDPAVLTPKRVVMAKFGLGMRRSMEAKQDNRYGVFTDLSEMLGEAFAVKEEIDAASLLNLGFTTVVATGYDGLALFSTSHTLSAGRFAPSATNLSAQPAKTTMTWSNRLAAAADLDYASWQDMATVIRRQVNYQGNYIQMEPDVIVVPPELKYVIDELKMSPGNPNSANRAANVVGSEMPRIVTWHYLLDTDAWFVRCKRHDLRWFDRMPLQLQPGDEFNTGAELVRGFRRYGFGFHNPMGWFGETGA